MKQDMQSYVRISSLDRRSRTFFSKTEMKDERITTAVRGRSLPMSYLARESASAFKPYKYLRRRRV